MTPENRSRNPGETRRNAGRNNRFTNKNNKDRKNSRWVTPVIILVMVAGVAIMLYPTFSNWYNERHQSRAIAEYNQTVSSNDAEKNRELWNEAVLYNEELAQTGVNWSLSMYNGAGTFGSTQETEESGSDSGGLDAAEESSSDQSGTAAADQDLAAQRERYENMLDVSGTGIMGYIDIDKVDIHLPIYHDTSESVLQVAVGHIAGTSLPVGGTPSHCVLTGHTGLPSARLFTDIDQLEEGDIFRITVLDHTLTYQVSDIQVVLPNEVESLAIQDGEDLCTLVTCTPYGINTHRLLVTGSRVSDEPDDSGYTTIHLLPESEEQEASWIQTWLPFIVIAAAAGIAIIVILAVWKRRG